MTLPPAEREESVSQKWATSRTELWAFYVYYIVSAVLSVSCLSRYRFEPNFRETTASQGSTSVPRSSRICSFSPDTIPVNLPLQPHAVRTPAASCRISERSAMVLFLQHSGATQHDNRLYAVNSIVLLTNGISFALQAIVLLVIGAWADYGTWRYVCNQVPLMCGLFMHACKAQHHHLFYVPGCGGFVRMARCRRSVPMAGWRCFVYSWV